MKNESKFGTLLLLLGLMLLFACCEPMQRNSAPTVDNITGKIVYFREGRLCFAALASKTYGGYNSVSITCVPCDSLNFKNNGRDE